MNTTPVSNRAGHASPPSGRVTISIAPLEPAAWRGKTSLPAGLQRVEPGANGMRGGGVDVDGVGLGQVLDAGTGADLDLAVAGEIGGGARGDVRRDLIGDHPARRPDELGEDRGVIASAGADLQRPSRPPARQARRSTARAATAGRC